MLGLCFSERFIHRTRITGSYTLEELQLFVREKNTQQMIKLLESFGLCVCCIVKEHHPVTRVKSRGKKHSADCFELFEQINSNPHSTPYSSNVEYTDQNGGSSNRNNGHSVYKVNQAHSNDFSLNTTQVLKPIVFDISRLNDTSFRNEDIQIEIPRLNLVPLYQGLWDNNEVENKRMLYSGVQLISSPGQFIHLMPRIQVHLRREISVNRKKYTQMKISNDFPKLSIKDQNNFYATSEVYMNLLDLHSNSITNKRRTCHSRSWNLVQWLHGSKITDSKGEIQVFICIDESKQVLEIRSRCLPQHTHLTFGLLHETIHLIRQYRSSETKNIQQQELQKYGPSKFLHEATDDGLSGDEDDEEKNDNQGETSESSGIRMTDRKSLHSVKLQNQLIKDLFFNDEHLAQEVSNHLLNVPSYPLPMSILQKLAKHIDVTERDPCRFNSLIQYLCYPDLKNLIIQWNQGICLWGTLSPTTTLLNFAGKYPIRILEWALLSSYGLDVIQLLYTSHILLNFSQVVFKQETVEPPNSNDNDCRKNPKSDQMIKYIRSSSTPRDSQL
ncbi:unnamed protein product [Heterobilharzia americana]|nr:unnamed protein product [Heterobilharzia americana]